MNVVSGIPGQGKNLGREFTRLEECSVASVVNYAAVYLFVLLLCIKDT